MNFWEQFMLGFVLSLLHALKVDPTRVPLVDVEQDCLEHGIGEVLGLPPRQV